MRRIFVQAAGDAAMVLWSLSGAVSGVWCGALELRRVRSFAPPGSRRPGSIRHRVPERTMGVQQSMGSTTTTPRGLPRRSRSNQARDCGVNPAPVRVPCSGSTAPAALLRIHAARNSLLRTHCSEFTAPNSLERLGVEILLRLLHQTYRLESITGELAAPKSITRRLSFEARRSGSLAGARRTVMSPGRPSSEFRSPESRSSEPGGSACGGSLCGCPCRGAPDMDAPRRPSRSQRSLSFKRTPSKVNRPSL